MIPAVWEQQKMPKLSIQSELKSRPIHAYPSVKFAPLGTIKGSAVCKMVSL